MEIFSAVLIAGILCGLLIYLYRQVREGKIPPFPERAASTFGDTKPESASYVIRGETFKSGGGGDFGGGGASGKF